MIIKEFIDKKFDHPTSKAGHAAEKQMAYYLRREFQGSDNIFVLNDVRVSVDNDKTQIDHLIVYPAGIFIVESKSVSGEITINSHGEWLRITKGSKKQGMSSPIIQAQTQAKNLKRYLDNQSKLFGWKLPNSFKYDVFVAVSDNGIINREYEVSLDELCKADQVAGKIKDLALKRLKLAIERSIDIKTGKEVALYLNGDNKKVESNHATNEDRTEYKVKSNDESSFKCSKCNSTEIQVAYGRSYYFKCSDCDGNTPLKKWLVCVAPECKPKIRKSKNNFFKDCPSCETSVLFFQNKTKE